MSNKLVVKMLFGSHLYHLNTPNSHKDYKGIFIPDLNDLLLSRAPKQISNSTGNNDSKNTSDDVDETLFSLHNFVKLALKGETAAIDMLHSSETIISSPEWEFLVKNRSSFYTKNMKAYIGYVRKQAAKYGIKGSKIAAIESTIAAIEQNDDAHCLMDIQDKLPTGEFNQFVTSTNESVGSQEFYEVCGRKFQVTNRLDYVLDALTRILESYGERARQAKANDGIDWKAISHALRAGYQARAIYLNGGFTYPLKETDFLKDVKQGLLDFVNIVQPELENLVSEVNILSDSSHYPEKADEKFWNDWVLKVYKEKLL